MKRKITLSDELGFYNASGRVRVAVRVDDLPAETGRATILRGGEQIRFPSGWWPRLTEQVREGARVVVRVSDEFRGRQLYEFSLTGSAAALDKVYCFR